MTRRPALILLTAIYLGLSQAGHDAAVALELRSDRLFTQASAELPLLKPGSEGDAVTDVQTQLQQLGYYSGTIDGVYRDGTQDAVAAFQQAQGLAVDGRVGTETRRQLEAAIAALPAPPETLPETPPDPPAPEPPAVAPPRRQPPWQWIGLGLAGAAAGAAALNHWRHRRTIAQPYAAPLPPAAADVVALESSAIEPPNGHAVLSAAADGHNLAETAEANAELAAVQETTRLPKINIAEELLKELHSPDPSLRRKAIWELGQCGDSAAIQPLVDLMLDSDSQQRSLILAAVSEIGVRSLKPLNRALIISLQDESSDVRKNAIRDVTRVYDLVAQISQLLGHAVNDPDAEVQETARWALGQLNRIRTVGGAEGASRLTNAAPDYLPSDHSSS